MRSSRRLTLSARHLASLNTLRRASPRKKSRSSNRCRSTYAKMGSGAYGAGARSRVVVHENMASLTDELNEIAEGAKADKQWSAAPPLDQLNKQSEPSTGGEED